jgi:hypothetical protein
VTDGKSSPAGNRTRVIRVTGGYTYLYTTEELKEKLTYPPMGLEPVHNIIHSPRGSMEEHLATDEEVAGSIPAAGVILKSSPAGNRTRVIRVTGGYTYLYTTEEN